MREKIQGNMNFVEIITLMAEGNPGAITVMTQLVSSDPLLLMSLDDMNMRGPQIWAGFKDHCEQDIDVFVKAINDRDQGMVDTVNNECWHPEMKYEGYDEKAVTYGGSWERDGVDPERRATHQGLSL